MKTVHSATFLSMMIISFFFSSCSDETIVDSVDKKYKISKRFEKINLDSIKGEVGTSTYIDSLLGIDGYPCGVKDVTSWALDHYEAQSGVIVGIWPHNARMQNSTEISKLKNKYGFNYILLASAYDLTKFNLILNSGFARNNIMAQILPNNFQQKTYQYGSIYAYYVDEPSENGYSMAGIRDAINNNAPGSKLIISGYKRTYGLDGYVSTSDGVLFSSYKHWWECLPGVWCSWPVDPDQRPDWTDMKNRYGNKSFMNWVGAHQDLSEYPVLLGHSANLGLPGVWLYQLEEVDNSEDNILSFCYNAWASGYLRRFERKYIYEYRCSYPNPCDCDRSLPDGWYLYKIWPMSDIREVFYQPY